MEKTMFAKFIQTKRKQADLSQKEMAEKLFVTESAVSKWERGVSYPDISMIQSICEVLSISEHELLTASDDHRQREIENQAKSYKRTVHIYLIICFLAYAGSLIPCFIADVISNHKPTWFFIVLTSELMAFSLLNLPLLIKKHKSIWTLSAFWLSLISLLVTCRIHNGGNWLITTIIAVTFGLSVIFAPFIFKSELFPEFTRNHRGLLSLMIDSLLLVLLIIVVMSGKNIDALKLCAFELTLPWALLLTIRYLKINRFFKSSICLVVFGIYAILQRPVMLTVLEKRPFKMETVDFSAWNNETYLNANIMFSILLICIVFALIFTAGGIFLKIRKSSNKK
ncbi:MAG: helix-turn-helix domain-containing protein [Ruminococcus sp.]|nr:helix-turn-helix domain-containing protein [Ruminococcus sp.]